MVLSFLQFLSLNESRSQAVELIQSKLKALGEPWATMLGRTGPAGDGVDGELGPRTREALERFLKEADPALKEGPLAPDKIKALGIGQSAGSGSPAGKGTGVIFVHGLTRDVSAEAQRELLAKGLGVNSGTIVLFSYKGDLARIESAVKTSPGSTVVLYSAGCGNAADVARLMKAAGSDLRRLWILEPWARGSGTVKSIGRAIETGLPESNVVTGPAIERGGGKSVWSGAQQTPQGKDHFGALTELGKLIAGR